MVRALHNLMDLAFLLFSGVVPGFFVYSFPVHPLGHRFHTILSMVVAVAGSLIYAGARLDEKPPTTGLNRVRAQSHEPDRDDDALEPVDPGDPDTWYRWDP